jgi:Carboxypeptidase regulatory-like domain
MKTIKLFLAVAVVSINNIVTAQTNAIIKGTIVDERGVPMLFVPVGIMQDTLIVASATTDVNGEFTIKEITPGTYNVKASSMGYNIQLVKGVKTNPNETAYVNIKMNPADNVLPQIIITEEYHPSIIKPTFSTVTPIRIDQIEQIASGKTDLVSMIVTLTPSVLPTPDGKDIYVRGSRRGSTAYYVDGNKVIGVPEVPGLGIASMEVLTGGMPAEYGDCTGGLVLITTKEYKWEMNKKRVAAEDRKDAKRK